MDTIQRILVELANLNPPQNKFNTKLMQQAVAVLGNPQLQYPVIHIAGSNGKGSTAAFIEQGLIAAGYRVGKYTSPYIHSLTECIVLNQQEISTQELVATYLKIKPPLLSRQLYLSSFEMLTLVMFQYFAEVGVDYLVLEAGMGGLDDATNVVDSQFSIITNISLEHTQWLGANLAAIARHKAGIIRNGITILADETPELLAAVAERTQNYINLSALYAFKTRLNVQAFTTALTFCEKATTNCQQVELGLFGHFQGLNFLAAYHVLRLIGISEGLIFAAAKSTRWPGRLQLIHKYPRIVADATHNPAGCEKLYASLHGLLAPTQVVIIASFLRDKDQFSMLKWYSRIGSTLILCGLLGQPRATPPLEIAKLARGLFQRVIILNSPQMALSYAKRLHRHMILISGSTYLLKNFVSI